MQRLSHPDEASWPHCILKNRSVVAAETSSPDGTVDLLLRDTIAGSEAGEISLEETLNVDAVIVATGYARDAHETMLVAARSLMPGGNLEGKTWEVRRDYGVKFEDGTVSEDAGVWLAGCNENTHGVSFSIALATP